MAEAFAHTPVVVTSKDAFAYIKGNDSIIDGSLPGISAGQITKEYISKIDAAKAKAIEKAKDTGSAKLNAIAYLNTAASRDINYALVGRKALRINSITSKNVAAHNRGVILIEE